MPPDQPPPLRHQTSETTLRRVAPTVRSDQLAAHIRRYTEMITRVSLVLRVLGSRPPRQLSHLTSCATSWPITRQFLQPRRSGRSPAPGRVILPGSAADPQPSGQPASAKLAGAFSGSPIRYARAVQRQQPSARSAPIRIGHCQGWPRGCPRSPSRRVRQWARERPNPLSVPRPNLWFGRAPRAKGLLLTVRGRLLYIPYTPKIFRDHGNPPAKRERPPAAPPEGRAATERPFGPFLARVGAACDYPCRLPLRQKQLG
jgi:hypothetical protein